MKTNRIDLDTGQDALWLIVSARRQWARIVFMSFWLVGWLFGEVFALYVISSGMFSEAGSNADPESAATGAGIGVTLFMLAWLCGWTLGGGFAIFSILKMLVGREKVEINTSYFSASKSVLFAYKKRGLPLDTIKRMRIDKEDLARRQDAKGEYRLQVDADGKTHTLVSALDAAESHEIADAIRGLELPFEFAFDIT